MSDRTAPLAANSRIMALKFMQRRTSSGGPLSSAAALTTTLAAGACTAATPASARSAGACTTAAGSGTFRAEAEWTLEPSRAARQPAHPGARVLREEDAGMPSASDHNNATLLKFSAGRRSFGSFNPRLEKRLAQISSNQQTVREEQAAAAHAADTSREQDAEKAALQQRANEEELKELQNSVSDAEMAASFAAKYGKYVPAPADSPSCCSLNTSFVAARSAPTMELPPVVSNPVRVRDERRGAEAPPKKARKGH